MASIGIHFAGSANFGQVKKQIAEINASLAAMQKQLLTVSGGVNQMNQAYKGFVNQAAAMDGVATSAMRAQTETAKMSEAIRRGDVRLSQRKDLFRELNNVTEQQLRLQRSLAVVRSRDAMGNIQGHLITPTNSFADAAARAHMRSSVLNQGLQAMSGNVVNWGKNMQWAGRQLTVGLTMPMVAFGAATGVIAYKVDQELTRLIKVYGDAGNATAEELRRVREDTLKTAEVTANAYGMMTKETAALGAEFAATGLEGEALQNTISETARIMTLGEVDKEEATKATIAIRSIFRLSNEELKRTFDTMNAIENETSTTIQDLIEAVPRAAQVVQELGGSMNDLQVFSVAFKEGGIAAGEGANALRSGLARVLRPTKITKQALDDVNISIDTLMEQNRRADGKLNLMDFMQDLGNAFNALDPVVAQRTMSQVFGIHRFNALSVLLRNITDDSSQAADALQIVERSSGDLARSAEEELKRWQESASGRVKRAIAAMNAELSQIGQGFLPVASFIINLFTKLLQVIQAIPGPIKVLIKAMLVIGVLIGPMIMLIGLFANLFGQVAKGILKWQAMTKGLHQVITGQEKFSALVSQAAAPLNAETMAVDRLTAAMAGLNTQLSAMALAGQQAASAQRTALIQEQEAAARRATNGLMVQPRTAGRYGGKDVIGLDSTFAPGPRRPVNTRATFPGIVGTPDMNLSRALNESVRPSQQIAESADETAKSHRASASALLGTVAIVGMLTAGQNEWVMKISTGLLILSLILPLVKSLTGMYKSMATWAQVRAKWDAVSAAMSTKMSGGLGFAAARTKAAADGAGALRASLTGARVAAAGIGRAIVGFLGPLGLVLAGVMAIYSAFKLIQRNTNKIKEDQQAMANAAKNSAEIVGFMWKANNETVVQHGTKIENVVDKMEKLKESQGPVLENLKEMNRIQQEAFVRNLALQARAHGATEEQAVEMAALYLRSIGRELEVRSILDMEALSTEAEALESLAGTWGERMRRQWENKFEQGPFEGFKRLLSGSRDELNTRAREDAKAFGEEFAQHIGGDVKINDEFFDQLRSQLRGQISQVFTLADLDEESRTVLVKAGVDITSIEEVVGHLAKLREEKNRAGTAFDFADSTVQLDKLSDSLAGLTEAQSAAVEAFLRAEGIDPKGFRTWLQVSNELGSNLKSTDQAWADYTRRLREVEEKTGKITRAQALQIQNEELIAAGLPTTTRLLSSFGDTAEGVAGQIQVLDDATRAMFEQRIGNYTNALKSNIQSAVSTLMDIGLEAFDKQTQAAEAGYERQAEAAEKSFDRQREASEKAFEARARRLEEQQNAEIDALESARDKRIDQIKSEADAEKKLDDTRQRMFERERTRMQRLAEDRNATLDFNMALREGNIDEAARLMNAGEARVLDRNMQDAEDLAAETSAERDAARRKQVERIDEQSKIQIDAIKKVHEEQKRALNDERSTARKALDESKRRRKEEIDDAKRAYNEQRRALRASLEQRFADEKLFTTKSEHEYKGAAARIQGILRENGVQISQSNQKWADQLRTGWVGAVDRAQQQIQSEMNWKQWSDTIADEVGRGLLGMSWEEFLTYMRTGVKPEVKEPPARARDTGENRAAVGTNAWRQGIVAHGGGLMGDRGGRPMSSGLFGDEVPTVLQRGEYVIKKDTVERMGSKALDLINDGTIPYEYHHSGGMVGGISGILRETMAGALREMMTVGVRRKNEEALMAGREELMLMGGILPTMDVEAAAPPGEDRFAPWLTPMQRRVDPSVMRRVWEGLGMVPGQQQITSGLRPGAVIAGTNRPSLHGIGKAVDIGALARSMGGNAATEAMGDNIARVFRSGVIPGVREVLWKTWTGGNHFNHVHVGFNHGGGMVGMDIPGLKTGGRIRMDNTLANLHANESVLTAPLSAKLERGITNMDNSSSPVYNININGSGITDPDALANVVVRKLRHIEKTKGPSRVIR